MKMLTEIVQQHLLEVAKQDGKFVSREAVASYIANCLTPGDIAGLICEAQASLVEQEKEEIKIKIL